MSQTSRSLRRSPMLLGALLAALLLVAGCSSSTPVPAAPAVTDIPSALPATALPTLPPTAPPPPTSTPLPTPTPAPTATPAPLLVALPPALPAEFADPLKAAIEGAQVTVAGDGVRPLALTGMLESARAWVGPAPLDAPGTTLAERFYAVVVPFDTVADDIALEELKARWAGQGGGPLYASADASLLSVVLGDGSPAPEPAETDMLALLEGNRTAVGIVPFDRLDPRLKVLSVDGANPLSNRLDAQAYPLAVAVKLAGDEADLAAPLLEGAIETRTNRDPSQLTTLIMTGVTAMARNTAKVMEQEGVLYPALVISDTLSAADITHISNEIPFLDDCKVNATKDNLVLCSHTRYWETLKAVGTDIVGLSGNHVNDFGREGARRSLQFYHDNQIPIYGSGLNIEEACAPLMWEHNGNTFAFIAALAYWPEFAWATEDQPGACYYYDNKERIAAMIKELSEKVDIVAVELQYYETYNPYPTAEQVTEFRELRDLGAHIVTGVQSHVPQAMEPYGAADSGGPGIIVYGLGNFFFDQMWSWETRTELMARHTIYDGRPLSTEILTAVLENYAQPRWATPKERAEILKRIFEAAPTR